MRVTRRKEKAAPRPPVTTVATEIVIAVAARNVTGTDDGNAAASNLDKTMPMATAMTLMSSDCTKMPVARYRLEAPTAFRMASCVRFSRVMRAKNRAMTMAATMNVV